MKVGDLFEVKRGNCSGLETHASGTIAFVSAGTSNAGVAGFVSKISGGRLFKDLPCLSVAANGDGGMAFASPKNAEFYATSDVAVLVPKWQHAFWQTDIQSKLIAVAAYIRKQRWRFGFGRKMSTRFADLDLDMSVIQSIIGAIVKSKPKVKTITQADVAALLAKLPNGVAIHDLFDMVKRNTFENSEASADGTVPLVSASSNNNAVVGFIETQNPKDIVPGNTISVAKDGVPMISRVQANPYAVNTHVVPLQAKAGTKYTDKELAIIAALIENQGWRYNYMRAAAWGRMGPQIIV